MNTRNTPAVEIRITISLDVKNLVRIVISTEVNDERAVVVETNEVNARKHLIDYQSKYEVFLRTLHIGEQELFQMVIDKGIVISLSERQFHFLYELAQVLIRDGKESSISPREKGWVKVDDLVLPGKEETGVNMKKEFRRRYQKTALPRNLFKLRKKLMKYGVEGNRLIESSGNYYRLSTHPEKVTFDL